MVLPVGSQSGTSSTAIYFRMGIVVYLSGTVALIARKKKDGTFCRQSLTAVFELRNSVSAISYNL